MSAEFQRIYGREVDSAVVVYAARRQLYGHLRRVMLMCIFCILEKRKALIQNAKCYNNVR